MRFVTYRNHQQEIETYGLTDSSLKFILPLRGRLGANCPQTLLDLIRSFDVYSARVQELDSLLKLKRISENELIPVQDVELLSPIPRPISMRDGYAFRQHVEAARRGRGLPMIPEFDQFPVFYFTNHLAVTGPGVVRVGPAQMERLDFELEIAIVTGKSGRNIPAGKADDYIFGYMIMNDWSARHLQTEEMKMNLGPAKGKDFATSLGPVLVTPDELESFAIPSAVGKKYNLKMTASINDRNFSIGNMKDMNFTFAQILERVSLGVHIEPGEVIGSGTCGTGCLLELNLNKITDNVWVKPGDLVRMDVDQLGTLENRIETEVL